MTTQRIRTFIAVEVDPAIRRATVELIDQLRKADANVKWVEPDNLHLTLKFLGDVAADDVAQVCDAVQKAVAEVPPFELEIRGAGAFPNTRRPQTIWIGAGDGETQMADLAERVELGLKKFGFRRDTRRYRVHLTLGRLRDGRGAHELGQLLQQFTEFQAGRMPVEEVIIFSSQLQRTGPIHEAMGRAHLGGR